MVGQLKQSIVRDYLLYVSTGPLAGTYLLDIGGAIVYSALTIDRARCDTIYTTVEYAFLTLKHL